MTENTPKSPVAWEPRTLTVYSEIGQEHVYGYIAEGLPVQLGVAKQEDGPFADKTWFVVYEGHEVHGGLKTLEDAKAAALIHYEEMEDHAIGVPVVQPPQSNLVDAVGRAHELWAAEGKQGSFYTCLCKAADEVMGRG